jgi:membrane protease YdiL (CAAX protease family)
MDTTISPHAGWLLLIGAVLSLATLLVLFQKHINGEPLLPYEARRRVPWGVGATLLAVYLVIMHLLAPLLSSEPATSNEFEPANYIWLGWLNIGLILFLSAVVVGWLVVICQATRSDLGLPESGQQFLADIRLGTIACLASLVPVFLLLLLAQFAIPTHTQHPLLEQLAKTPSPLIFLTAAGAAILAAPISEEIVFRLLLQGALERYEDQWIGHAITQRIKPVASIQDLSVPPTGHTPVLDHTPPPNSRDEPKIAESSMDELFPDDSPGAVTPTEGPFPDLPFGWAPILASGLLFGLAHFGHGIDPIPLFAFGVVLGYLYQRTHRIVPCITAHMLFNSFSLAVAWLQLG